MRVGKYIEDILADADIQARREDSWAPGQYERLPAILGPYGHGPQGPGPSEPPSPQHCWNAWVSYNVTDYLEKKLWIDIYHQFQSVSLMKIIKQPLDNVTLSVWRRWNLKQ